LLTGEQRTQVTEEVEIIAAKQLTFRVDFPGCMVTPNEQTIDPDTDEITLVFHVMSMAKGKHGGNIRIMQEASVLTTIPLDFKVVDQRIAKVLSLAGIVIGVLPPALTYLLGVNINEMISTQLVTALPVVTSPLLLMLEIASGGLMFGLAGLTFFLYRGKRSSLFQSNLSLPGI